MKALKYGVVLIMPLAMSLTGCASRDNLMFDYGAAGASELQRMDPIQSRMLLDSAAICCTNFSTIRYDTIAQPGQYDYLISNENQAFSFTTGKSFVQGLELPKTEGEINVTISSVVMSSVFIPSVLILDAQFKPIRLIADEQIKYAKATILNSDRYIGQFTLQENERAKYVLIFTTEQAMNGETQLEPLAQEALSSGAAKVAERVYINHPVSHSSVGAVRIAVDFVLDSRVGEVNLKSEIGVMSDTTHLANEIITVESETKAMFTQLIRQAVKSGDLNKAMNMVQEAERAGFSESRQVLIDAISQQ
jgi:maltose operon protein